MEDCILHLKGEETSLSLVELVGVLTLRAGSHCGLRTSLETACTVPDEIIGTHFFQKNTQFLPETANEDIF